MFAGAVQEKSCSFALRTVKMYPHLNKAKQEFLPAGQVLCSGTHVGADAEEAGGAQSSKDFFPRMTIACKEAGETHVWRRFLRDAGYLEEKSAASIPADCEERLRLLGKIRITTCFRLKPNPPE